LRRTLPIYRERRNTMVAALQRHLPTSVTWTAPSGGFCTWLTMPSYHPFADLERAALDAGWAVTPGEVFLAEPTDQKSIRLCYGTLTPDVIQTGVEVIGQLVRARLADAAEHPEQQDAWTPLV